MNAPNWYPGKEVTWFLKNINSYTKFKRQITSRAFFTAWPFSTFCQKRDTIIAVKNIRLQWLEKKRSYRPNLLQQNPTC